ncbi:MAG: gliding motility-associated C-terminal domain-containing protein [Flavobacteriales bacterium]|jgi:gliding motility-associated-like protein|nr:gliding motility-associated C-terminal domain-containing protein [Flavobacteriales bacterium]
MRHYIVIIVLITWSIGKLYAQQNLILNNDVYLVVNEGEVVLENSSSNALRSSGTGGNIISESQNGIINWKVGEDTGRYVVPFATTNWIKIPLEILIEKAGTGGDGLKIATYQTDEENQPLPLGVTPLINCKEEDHSLAVVDRFWNIEATNYNEKPQVKLSLAYEDSELGGENSIVEENLTAMSYNPIIQKWENVGGVTNESNNAVNQISVNPATFNSIWLLADSSSFFPELCVDGLIIPEAFTPNGDAINETFQILGLQHYKQHNIAIYNRWGSLIFYTEDYDGLWEGTNQDGQLLPAGLYFYVINLTLNNETEETQKGTVFIQY